MHWTRAVLLRSWTWALRRVFTNWGVPSRSSAWNGMERGRKRGPPAPSSRRRRRPGRDLPMLRAARPTPALTAVVAVAVVALISSTLTLAASAGPPRPAIGGEGSPSAIPGSYVVTLKDTASLRSQGVGARARALSNTHRGTLRQVWQHALHGFAATMTRDKALRLAAEPDVESVVQDQRLAAGGPAAPAKATAAAAAAQTPVSWG